MAFQAALISLLLTPTAMAGIMARDSSSPIKVTKVDPAVNQTSNIEGPGKEIFRDMGYNGKIGNTYFRVYSDSSFCSSPIDAPDSSSCQFAASNSMAVSDSKDISKLTDFPGMPQTCAPLPGWDGFRLHPTSVLPISNSNNQGILYYQKIDNNKTGAIDGHAMEAGVAVLTYDGKSVDCKVQDSMWNRDEAQWGDHDIIIGKDGYIYLLGGATTDMQQSGHLKDNNVVWAARVKEGDYASKNKYQYWDGSNWQTSWKSTYPAVLTSGQGSIHFNAFYNAYMYIYPQPAMVTSKIVAKLAASPQGPWGTEFEIWDCTMGGQSIGCYGPEAQPQFDPSGKTLAFDVSMMGHDKNNGGMYFPATAVAVRSLAMLMLLLMVVALLLNF